MAPPNLEALVARLITLAPANGRTSAAEIDEHERRLGVRLSDDFRFVFERLNGTWDATDLDHGWLQLWSLRRWETVDHHVRSWPDATRGPFREIASALVFADYSLESWHYAAVFSTASRRPTSAIYLLHLQPYRIAASLGEFLEAALVDGPLIHPPARRPI